MAFWSPMNKATSAGTEDSQTVLFVFIVNILCGYFFPATRSLEWIQAFSTPSCANTMVSLKLLVPKKSQRSLLGGFVVPGRPQRGQHCFLAMRFPWDSSPA